MFERYTEKARRVIFFARYEASQFGTMSIEPEHLLLGLIREDDKYLGPLLRTSHLSVEAIRGRIGREQGQGDKVSASVDLPLSSKCKRVLGYAADESELLRHRHIGTEHLLLGLLREEKTVACEILQELGLGLSSLREEIKQREVGREAIGSAARASNAEADLIILVRDMRDLARAMIEKCDQIEDGLRRMPPGGGKTE